MRKPFYKGAQGNLSLHLSAITLASLAAGQSTVLEESLPVGTEITGVRLISDALGANTAIKLDLQDRDGGKKAVLPSTTTTSAVTSVTPIKPVYIGDEGLSDLIIENAGSGAATGEVTVYIEYRFKGY